MTSRRSPWRGISAAAALLACAAPLLRAAPPEWPQFRGPNATGIAADAHPPTEFGPEQRLLWKTDLPAGSSSPVIAGDRIFLTGFSDGRLETICLRRSDGSILWRQPAQPEKIEPVFEKFSNPAAPSCATDGERVVSYFGSGGLTCFDMDGRRLWSVPMPCIETQDGFGTGNSPILHDGVVYLLRDELGEWDGLFAFDARTGQQLWRTSRKDFHVSYGTPVVWDGCLVCIGDLRAKAYDLKTGAERWFLRGLAAYPCTTAAAGPDGNLYLSTWSSGSKNEPNPEFDQLLTQHDQDRNGTLSAAELAETPMKDFLGIMDDNKNGVLDREEWEGVQSYMRTGHNAVVCIRPGAHGDITDTPSVAWKNERGASYVPSPLAFDGRLFLVKDGGFATCYDASTGKLIYDKQRLGAEGDYYASPIFADGRVYACSSRGVVTVLDARADKLTILGRAELREPITATPAAVGEALYVRTGTHLWAFGGAQ